jgi:hypothetical protein
MREGERYCHPGQRPFHYASLWAEFGTQRLPAHLFGAIAIQAGQLTNQLMLLGTAKRKGPHARGCRGAPGGGGSPLRLSADGPILCACEDSRAELRA